MIQIVQHRTVNGHKGMFHPEGHPLGFTVPNHAYLFENPDKVMALLNKNVPAGYVWKNLYYCAAHQILPLNEHGKLAGSEQPIRGNKSFDYQPILAFDIDHCDTLRAHEYLSAVASVLVIEPIKLIMVCTGNGLHIIAHLRTPIRSEKFMKECKPAYNELCAKMERAIAAAGLPLDRTIGGKVDPVIFDCGRILRLPGTINSKPDKDDKTKTVDKECTLLQYSDTAHEIDMLQLSGLDKVRDENISPEQIRRQYPRPDMPEIVKECRFIQECLLHPEGVHEPDLFALIGLMAAQPPGNKATFNGQELTPRALCELVAAGAVNSASLARQEFDRKWEDASRYGAQKCATIAGHSSACATCPHSGKIPTPLALKSEEHISSEEMGFWVLNAKGQYSHPHYGDLVKVYAAEKFYVAAPKERLFTFDGNKYTETAPLTVKAWMERKVNPADPTREAHRVEFLKKAMTDGAISEEEEDYLFNESLHGKLNCSNGTVDIMRGVLTPHSPSVGFRYVLPYEYMEGASSETFIDWLATIMQNRPELMEALLDVMAYCLWPSYDDHMFAFFVGEGANGKSTLLHIMQAMLGKHNFSAISIQQLGGNRFAPANLEGKLANLSEESSGYEMSHEEMNVIKNLSAGGEMMAERKGSQGFLFKNKAKLVFSANKPPRFKENGVALQRRMVAIPFDHKITDPDSRIEDKLIAEVPAIVSMLVRRIQENIKINGRFLVSRGGAVATKTRDDLIFSGNTVMEWAKEHVESGVEIPENTYIECAESFHKYKNWCEENGYRFVNKGLFSHYMFARVVSRSVLNDDNRMRVAGKQVRVFKRTKWKDEAYV